MNLKDLFKSFKMHVYLSPNSYGKFVKNRPQNSNFCTLLLENLNYLRNYVDSDHADSYNSFKIKFYAYLRCFYAFLTEDFKIFVIRKIPFFTQNRPFLRILGGSYLVNYVELDHMDDCNSFKIKFYFY